MLTLNILKANGEAVCRTLVRHLTPDESKLKGWIKQKSVFDTNIVMKLGGTTTEADFDKSVLTLVYKTYKPNVYDGKGTPDPNPADQVPAEPPEEITPTPEIGDTYLGATILLLRGGTLARGQVTKHKRDQHGEVTGRAHIVPTLDTCEYTIEWDNGGLSAATANVIAELMYDMCDKDDNRVMLSDTMVGHRCCLTTNTHADQKFTDKNGKVQYKRSTKGWQMCVQWKDGLTSCEKISVMKECYPVQTAEYAVSNNVDSEPAFNWWVSHILKKHNRIISKVKLCQKRFVKTTEKYGIDLPRDAEHAKERNRRNSNTLWADAIAKEMKNVWVAFDFYQMEKGSQTTINASTVM